MSCLPVNRWLYGKLPSTGDFVFRGLDGELREAIDAWLASEMEEAGKQFVDDFAERYDAAPAWTFVDCDPNGRWSGGALCASVDSVGRRFPMLVGGPAEEPSEAARISIAWLEALHASFAGNWDADRLHSVELESGPTPWQPWQPAWSVLSERGPAIVVHGRFPAGIVRRMIELAR